MPQPHAALRRLPSQELTYAQIVVERAIAAFKAVPPWKDATTELMHVLDLGRLFLNCVSSLADADERDAFNALYRKCQECARPGAAKHQLAELQERKTNALILDTIYELQRQLRELSDKVEKLPKGRARKTTVVNFGGRTTTSELGKAVAS